jgi:hypothetical protein
VKRDAAEDLVEEAVRLLFSSSFMTVATVDDGGQPWATPVEYACDEDLRFYWSSHVDARHSRNVLVNPRAAISIYDSHQVPGVYGHVQGLYAEGTVEAFRAEELGDVTPSIRRWIAWRDATLRVSRDPAPPGARDDPEPWRTYRLTVSRLYALDPRGHPDVPGVRIWKVALDLADAFTRAYRSRVS